MRINYYSLRYLPVTFIYPLVSGKYFQKTLKNVWSIEESFVKNGRVVSHSHKKSISQNIGNNRKGHSSVISAPIYHPPSLEQQQQKLMKS